MRERFPARSDIVPVYAVVAFFIQGWTLNKLLWQLSSWADYLNTGTLLGIFAYRIAASFFESMAIMAFLVFLCLVLPQKYFKETFVPRGTVSFLILFGAILLFWNRFYAVSPGLKMVHVAYIWLICAVLIAFGVAHFLVKIGKVREFLYWLSDRMIIFLYILFPVSILSLAVILVRNIF